MDGRSDDEGFWRDATWFVVLNGIADRWLWAFDTDRWRLRHGSPACGSLGILPMPGGAAATIDDAVWLADVIAYDHDAPVGIQPAVSGPGTPPKDPDGLPQAQPIHPYGDDFAVWYWQNISRALGAAAELRFNDSFVLRYSEEPIAPSTDFSARFIGREPLVALYAMAARQADPLSEYLCLYRVLEAADQINGTAFAGQELPSLLVRDYGELLVAATATESPEVLVTDVFATYRHRARVELDTLASAGVLDVPKHLYEIRNSLAHGKTNVLTGDFGSAYQAAVRALPIVKLLARAAIEP